MRKLFSESNKYRLLCTIRYLGDGFFYPFFALYLTQRNLTESHIGFILSISPLLAIIMNPIYTRICKKPSYTKNVLLLITILEGLCIISVSFVSNFYIISAITLLMAIFGSCHYGLLDALCALHSDKAQINYSSIRVFGSAAYIVATALSGLITKISFQMSFSISGLLFILCGLIYHILTPIEIEEKEEDVQEAKMKDVLKSKEFLFFALVYMLLMGVTKTTDNFYSVYLQSRGISSSQYGFIYSYFVLFEVISLIILNRFVKSDKNTYLLLLISCLCLLSRTLANYLYLHILVVVLISCLRGIGYAIVLHICYAYIIKILGEKLATKAVMFITLVYAIYQFAFNNIGGIIIDDYSYKLFYLINIIIVSITIVLVVTKMIIDRIKCSHMRKND
ncbi:MAG: MFS transporter [Bacilli bacterium]|nr:MFS transporter [Bacilli bacterium]